MDNINLKNTILKKTNFNCTNLDKSNNYYKKPLPAINTADQVYVMVDPNQYLKNRGGNKAPGKDLFEGFETKPQNDKKVKFQEDKEEVKFYPGDKILSGNYFDGWNDTHFFQTTHFMNDKEFWQDPFKYNMNH